MSLCRHVDMSIIRVIRSPCHVPLPQGRAGGGAALPVYVPLPQGRAWGGAALPFYVPLPQGRAGVGF